MPYELKKVYKKDLYFVVNKETGRKHSYEPLSKETALKQIRALYMNEYNKDYDKDILRKNPKKSRAEKGSEEAKRRMAIARQGWKKNKKE